LKALQTILTDKWDVVRGDASFRLAREERALKQTEKTKKQTVDEYITVKSPAIKQALGERIEDLEGMEALQQEKIKKLGTSINRLDFERLMEHSMKFIENPHGMWVSGDLEDKQLVLKLAFAGSLKYDKKSGYGTLPKPLLYKVLEDSGDTESCMVEMA
ncbi:MAG: hypothetical protein KAR12_00170, partial [Methylococcales bacterium]|nr:hypothetical protein [Methylococcales bacterium]